MLLAQRQSLVCGTLLMCISRASRSNYQLAFDKYIEAASLTQWCIWINNSAASGSRGSGLISSWCTRSLLWAKAPPHVCQLLAAPCVCLLFVWIIRALMIAFAHSTQRQQRREINLLQAPESSSQDALSPPPDSVSERWWIGLGCGCSRWWLLSADWVRLNERLIKIYGVNSFT